MTDSIAFRGFKHKVSSSLRDILPRAELLRQDRLPGKYPTLTRIGDASRRGNNNVYFDDTNTVVYQTSVTASFPTTLPINHKFLSSDISSSIFLVSNVTKPGSEQFVVLPTQNESYVAFKEDKLFAEDIKTSQFYLTGSDNSDIGTGFSTKLGSKTIIKIPLPIMSSTLFTASMTDAYYNVVRQCFEPIPFVDSPRGSHTNAVRNPFASREDPNGTANGLLFNCLGIPHSRNYAAITDTYVTYGYNASAGAAIDYVADTGLLISGTYEATSSQLINVSDYISHPFLVEKAILELPFLANNGWLDDKTRHAFTNNVFWLLSDVGGPALTFGLLNQIGVAEKNPNITKTTRRDLIMSGTVIPYGDSVEQFYSVFWQSSGGGVNPPLVRTVNGFSTFNVTPACVVSGTGTGFTGSIKLFMDAAVSNGRCFEGTRFRDGTLGSNYGLSPYANLDDVNPVGRAMFGTSGRSIFGKEFIQKSHETSSIASSYWQTSASFEGDDYYILNTNVSQKSPYLLYPTDKLVAYMKGPRSALTMSAAANPFFATSSNRVEIQTGTAYLTLYGCQVANNVEFHDTLNQRLETNEIHESVGNDPILDQFDVGYGFELSGSYIDDFSVLKAVPYVTLGQSFVLTSSNETSGLLSNFSIDASTSNNPWSTQREWSTFRKIYELKKNTRNLTLVSENEIFCDSRVPDPYSVIKTQSSTNWALGSTNNFDFVLSTGRNPVWTQDGRDNKGIGDWVMSFPFEPKFSGISSLVTTALVGDVFDVRFQGSGANQTHIFVKYEKMGFEFGESAGSFTRRVAGELPSSIASIGDSAASLGLTEFVKFFYGFGDGRSSVDNCHAEFRNKYTATEPINNCVEIRGWRHGLLSAFPTKTSATWRRNRFGQFRDMLEQRLDAKFVSSDKNNTFASPVQVKFVNGSGTTLPEYTQSSNLSNEATSSLPYFDGVVRNREEPMTLARLNQSLVVI